MVLEWINPPIFNMLLVFFNIFFLFFMNFINIDMSYSSQVLSIYILERILKWFL